MLTQVYMLNTKLNFGKYYGNTILEIFKLGYARYIGYLIFNDKKRFVLHPDTIKELDNEGFFDDMPISYYGSCGVISTKSIVGFSKSDLIENINNKYQEFIRNPDAYEDAVNSEIKQY